MDWRPLGHTSALCGLLGDQVLKEADSDVGLHLQITDRGQGPSFPHWFPHILKELGCRVQGRQESGPPGTLGQAEGTPPGTDKWPDGKGRASAAASAGKIN